MCHLLFFFLRGQLCWVREGQLTQLWDFISGNSRTAAQLSLCASTYRVASPRQPLLLQLSGNTELIYFPSTGASCTCYAATQMLFLLLLNWVFFFSPEIYHSGFSVTGMWNIYLEGRMILILKMECSLQTPRGQLPPPLSPLCITRWAAPCRTGKPGEALKEHIHTGPFLVF